jgi:hypothetical protein
VINQILTGEEKEVLKIIGMIGFGAALTISSIAAVAQSGYGASSSAPSTSTFDRAWNHANESKERAGAGAAQVGRQGQRGYYHLRHH